MGLFFTYRVIHLECESLSENDVLNLAFKMNHPIDSIFLETKLNLYMKHRQTRRGRKSFDGMNTGVS